MAKEIKDINKISMWRVDKSFMQDYFMPSWNNKKQIIAYTLKKLDGKFKVQKEKPI